ncbi:winged helix-turn-helix domain-containing protein [Nonomuraea terrae]|uniref:winged helix-turn-helix domain-containing protein n=1 Tax=Nonomuraea terrae TaxID=2530383 RepID=UPI0037ADB137
MLRFHITSDDLLRVRVARRPHPMWEISFSLQLLQTREAALLFDPWRRAVRRALARAGLTAAVAELARLYPLPDYWPDFLVPADDSVDLDTGLDLVMATPRTVLKHEMTLMAHRHRSLPRWSRDLAAGDLATVERLGELLRRYHQIAVAPYTAHVRHAFDAERTRCAEAVLGNGVEGLLSSFPKQLLSWHDGRLNVPCPVDADFRVGGRALTLQPSFFCLRRPTAFADPEQPPTLAYPIPHTVGWLQAAGHDDPRQPTDHDAVARLIGHARAAALDALDRAMTTSQLAETLRLSAPTASRHAATLREAGLITTERRGRSVLHTRTAMGTALLEGHPTATSSPPGDAVPPANAAHWAYIQENAL